MAAVFGTSMLIIPLFLNKQFVMAFLWALIVGTVALFALFIGWARASPSRRREVSGMAAIIELRGLHKTYAARKPL